MAPSEGRIARPEQQWGCRWGTSASHQWKVDNLKCLHFSLSHMYISILWASCNCLQSCILIGRLAWTEGDWQKHQVMLSTAAFLVCTQRLLSESYQRHDVMAALLYERASCTWDWDWWEAGFHRADGPALSQATGPVDTHCPTVITCHQLVDWGRPGESALVEERTLEWKHFPPSCYEPLHTQQIHIHNITITTQVLHSTIAQVLVCLFQPCIINYNCKMLPQIFKNNLPLHISYSTIFIVLQ